MKILDQIMDGSAVPRYHAGVGMIQCYISDTKRIHVWHPDLPQELEAFGNRHNHRFHLTSQVLMGKIVDSRLDLSFNPFTGKFGVYEVKPAHFGDTPTPKLLGGFEQDLIVREVRQIHEGCCYTLPRGVYHETRAEGLTVTIIDKGDQTEDWARIIATQEQIPLHGMKHDIPQHYINQLFFSALRKLSFAARDRVERIENGGRI